MRSTTVLQRVAIAVGSRPQSFRTPGQLTAPFPDGLLADFETMCRQSTSSADYPAALRVEGQVPIYKSNDLETRSRNATSRRDIMDELYRCLHYGPGVYVVEGCFKDHHLLDRVDAVFDQIIKRERGTTRGDHFAPDGKNDRIWNSFQKHALQDPKSFIDYYSSETLALAAEAWVGPGYQMTTQVNIVKPGGIAQAPHRDYHLGFQSEETAARFPIPSQIATQFLTLQAAVAHTDMPIESGPTMLLPYSQQFEYGYLAYRRPEFREMFLRSFVQLELKRGDGLFFNPALFHAAGNNTTENHSRSANLLQISAPWGKPMEHVDRTRILLNTWTELELLFKDELENIGSPKIQAVVSAIADDYSFPTNLDKDPPSSSGHCPATQKDLVLMALEGKWGFNRLTAALVQADNKRLAD